MQSMCVGDILKNVCQVNREDNSMPVHEGTVTGTPHSEIHVLHKGTVACTPHSEIYDFVLQVHEGTVTRTPHS